MNPKIISQRESESTSKPWGHALSVNKFMAAVLLVLASHNSSALVGADAADIDFQSWMATITILDPSSEEFITLCQGSLVHQRWVLAGIGCMFDTYQVLKDASAEGPLNYFVFFADSDEAYEASEPVFSDDFSLIMFNLNRSAPGMPIPLSDRPAAELVGETVRIYNNVASPSLGDSLFNPNGVNPVICTINGRPFATSSGFCYITSPLNTSSSLKMLSATVLDPESDSVPDHPLNRFANIDSSGASLYLDFGSDSAIPCYEDHGAPIVATIGGEVVQVGVVARVGEASSISLCNNSLLSGFTSVAAKQDFIEATIAAGRFTEKCPASTTLRLQRTGFATARLHWDAVDGVTGYKLVFTTRLGYEPLQTADVGNITEISADLDVSNLYSVAVLGYNPQCTGPLSESIPVLLANEPIE